MAPFEEAQMTINGHTLTIGQSMTVRVALETMAMDIHGNDLYKDAMGEAYMARIEEMRKMMYHD